MDSIAFTRRDLMQLALAAAIPGGLLQGESAAADGADPNAAAFRLLDRFVAGYSAAMNAPGLILAVADSERTLMTAAYGFEVGDHLFRLGSRPSSPERAEFSAFVDGVPRVLRFDGGEFQRVEAGRP